jgi:hypothetical protein
VKGQEPQLEKHQQRHRTNNEADPGYQFQQHANDTVTHNTWPCQELDEDVVRQLSSQSLSDIGRVVIRIDLLVQLVVKGAYLVG